MTTDHETQPTEPEPEPEPVMITVVTATGSHRYPMAARYQYRRPKRGVLAPNDGSGT